MRKRISVGFPELLTRIEVVFGLFIGDVVGAELSSCQDLICVLEGLLLEFGVHAKPFSCGHVLGLLSRVCGWEPQEFSELEVHVGAAVRRHPRRLNQHDVFGVGHVLDWWLVSVCLALLKRMHGLRLQLFEKLGVALRRDCGESASTLHAVFSTFCVLGRQMLREWVKWVHCGLA